MHAKIAWLLAALTLALTAVDIAVTSTYRTLLSQEAVAQHGFPFANGAVVGSALLGAVIVSRDGRHVIGWLLSLIGVVGALSLALEAYSIWVVSEGGPGPSALGSVLGLVASLIGGQFAIAMLALLFLLAPDGRLLSPRWRYLAAAAPLGVLCCAVALLSGDPTTFDIEGEDVGPVRELTFTVGFALISIVLVGALVSMLVRLRRSRGEERQQMAVIAVAAGSLAFGIAALFVMQSLNGGRQTWAASVPLYLAYLSLPVLFAVAVLRYRLYDVSLIIDRAIVLAVATAFAAVGYITLVVVVGNQVDSRTGSFAISLLGTAVVALAFQPLRRAVVRLANRLAYGPRARPYVALSEFSSRLAETPSPDALLLAVADAAGRAVSARGATVTIDLADLGVVSAAWGQTDREAGQPYDVPLRSGGVALGHITVLVPHGRQVRASDARLLQALADQAAVAVRNAAMETQLAERVAALDRTTQQLAESRARIIDADDEVRRTLEAAISRDVLPPLLELPDRLGAAQVAVASGAPHRLEELVDLTNCALEALRDLTRGVFPTQLARAGLEPALRSCLGRGGLAARLVVDPSASGRRFSSRVEAAIYFSCSEAVRALSDSSSVELTAEGEELLLRITGMTGEGLPLRAVDDRVAAVGGCVTAADGAVTVRIPAASGVLAGTGSGPPGL